jgi:Glycosyltransferases involved in cell wall biogenesis
VSKVSCYIIAFNEANKIRPAIESVIHWADEVILCDSHSTDGTAEIAESLGARVVQIDFEGFGKLKTRRSRPVPMNGSFRWILTSAAPLKHAMKFSHCAANDARGRWRT